MKQYLINTLLYANWQALAFALVLSTLLTITLHPSPLGAFLIGALWGTISHPICDAFPCLVSSRAHLDFFGSDVFMWIVFATFVIGMAALIYLNPIQP